jgi:hypothetical protein
MAIGKWQHASLSTNHYPYQRLRLTWEPLRPSLGLPQSWVSDANQQTYVAFDERVVSHPR